MNQVSQPRIGELDGLRGLAIAAVVANHLFRWKLLWAGVDLFFVISGFVITGLLLAAKNDSAKSFFGHFYARRARRILPPYVLLLLVTSLVFGVVWMHEWFFYFFAMNWIVAFQLPHLDSLDPLWSLAVEEQFYLVWPLLIFTLSETAIAWVATVLLVAAPLLRWFMTPMFAQHTPIYVLLPFRMDLLAAGALLAIVWRRRRAWIAHARIASCILALAAIAALVLLSRQRGWTLNGNTREANLWVYELVLIACVGVVTFALSQVAVLRLRPLRYLGRISYSIYLIHATFQIWLAERIDDVTPWAALTIALSLAYAAASWHWLERPILNRGTRPHMDEKAIAE